MQICRVSAPSWQFIKFLTGGLYLKINVSYTITTVQYQNMIKALKRLIGENKINRPKSI